jgi:hypothetical protein
VSPEKRGESALLVIHLRVLPLQGTKDKAIFQATELED